MRDFKVRRDRDLPLVATQLVDADNFNSACKLTPRLASRHLLCLIMS